MTMIDTTNPPADNTPIGVVRLGHYRATHIEAAHRLAVADPHKPIKDQIIRLEHTRVVVVIAETPVLISLPGNPGIYTWKCDVRASTPFETVIQQQLELIEASLAKKAPRAA